VEESSADRDYSAFREKLLSAKSKDRKGKEGIGGRYAVFDIEYELDSGEGKRNKITFISWCPDDAPQYVSLAPTLCGRLETNRGVAEDDVLFQQGSFEEGAQWTCC
jgi:hypothetical protein